MAAGPLVSEWVVTVEAAASAGAVLGEDLVDELLDSLPGAAVAVRNERIGVTFSVAARDPGQAAKKGLEMWRSVQTEGLVVVRVEAVTAAEHDAEAERPNFPVLLGVAEVAERLGVSKARASELARLESFPRPVAHLASGPVWTEPSVSGHLEGWKRKPGRPRKVDVQLREALVRVEVARKRVGWASNDWEREARQNELAAMEGELARLQERASRDTG